MRASSTGTTSRGGYPVSRKDKAEIGNSGRTAHTEKCLRLYPGVSFLLLLGLGSFAGPLRAQFEVPLMIQETLYPGVPSTPRTRDPLTVGIPLPESAGVRSASQLGLAGPDCGQFRILGRWPSGNAKWILIDTQVDLGSGEKSTRVVLTSGQGNFGGEVLARENAASVIVDTGSAQFTIRKARFNLFDHVVVRGKTLVSPGTSRGLVLTGPPPPETFCGVCKTIYASSNDALSKAVIEENGPVRAVIKATGAHKDRLGRVYMRFTVRMTFYKGKSYVKVTSILQNADENKSGFNSAYKGFASYEAQLSPSVGARRSFSIGAPSQPIRGTFSGNEDVYLYQAYSDKLEHYHWSQPPASSPGSRGNEEVKSYIARKQSPSSRTGWVYDQEGYQVVRGSEVLASGNSQQFPEGWANLQDETGAGVLIGVQELSAYWPKSLEFRAGGTDIRIGIWPKYNAQPYYQAWPQYSTHDLWFEFHDEPLPAPSEEFRKLQHYLIARAPIQHYSRAQVFPFELLEPEEEDGYYKSLGVACCVADQMPNVFRYYFWPQPGEDNQSELRWAYLLQWLTRGFTGRYLTAANFYRFQADQAFPRADGFHWRSQPPAVLDYWGFPVVRPWNQSMAHRSWIDQNHAHWYGMTDYYFMTGDENIRDALLDGVKDRFLNEEAKLNTGALGSSRAIGAALMGFARLYTFLSAIGDHDANQTLSVADRVLKNEVFPELDVSGFGRAPNGFSRTRGVNRGCCETIKYRKLVDGRIAQTFQHSILIEGMWEYAQVRGPGWPRYEELMDLAYGAGQWALNEMFVDSGELDGSGFRYLIFLDFPNSVEDNADFHVSSLGTVLFPFFIVHEFTGDTAWRKKFETMLRKFTKRYGRAWPLASTYSVAAVVHKVLHPESRPKLVNVPLEVKKGGTAGTYVLSWTAPKGAQSYRLKYTEGRRIVEWLRFDPLTNAFGLDPYRNCPWFAANLVANLPEPGPAGSQETMTLVGMDPAKDWTFALKAYVSQMNSGPD